MTDQARDANDVQRDRSETRLRTLALDEIARALEQIGIDIKSSEARRELRTRLDYLDRLYDDQSTNRQALDWAREMMKLSPTPRAVMEWAAERMRIEGINRDAVRKTLVEKATGGLLWLLLGGLGAALGISAFKGHGP